MKKVFSIVLVLLLCLCSATSVFASSIEPSDVSKQSVAPVTSVKFPQSAVRLVKGKSVTIPAVAYTSDGTKAKLRYTSQKPAIAKVTAKGKITANKVGTTRVYARADNGKRAYITVRVVENPVALQSIRFKKVISSLQVGATATVAPVLKPTTATGAAIKFKSSKPKVAKIDATGKITALGAGKTNITISTLKKKVTFTLQVTAPISYTINRTILNRDGIVVVAKSLELNGIMGPELMLQITNNRTHEITMQTRGESVNGFMASFICSEDVQPGKTAIADVTIPQWDLDKYGIKKISNLEFKLHFFSWDDWTDSDSWGFDTAPIVLSFA